MDRINTIQSFSKWLISKVASTSRIIAPPRLPLLYRLTMLTLFAYIAFGIGSLSYKNLILLDTYRTINETKEIKRKVSFYSSNLDLITTENFIDSYYREYFAMTKEGEILLLTTEQVIPKR